MKRNLFVAPDGAVYEYDQVQIDQGYPLGAMRPMTDQEIEAHLNPAPAEKEVLQSALEQRDAFLALATLRVNPLKDAVDLGKSTEEDESLLAAWKEYRVEVNRITDQEGFPNSVTWPEQPSQ